MSVSFLLRRSLYVAMAVIVTSVGFPVQLVKAEEDTTPPTLTAFSVSSQNVDVTSAPQSISVNVEATDDLSGVQNVSVIATPPSNSGSDLYTTWSTAGPNTWSGTMNVPQYIADGEWTVRILVFDQVGNTTQMEGQTLVDNGFPGFINITSIEDLVAPAVQSVNINPDTVDVTLTSQLVEVRVQTTDNLSGIEGASFILTPPNPQNNEIPISLAPVVNQQGGEEWVGSATVQQYVSNGDWLGRLIISDKVGNTTYMEAAALAAGGFEHTLTVISNEDTQAPTIQSVAFTPDTVDVSTTPQEVVARVKSVDDLSGVAGVYVILTPPSGANDEITAVLEEDVNAAEEGLWVGAFYFPQYIESGEWTARLIALDNIGNLLSLNPGQLAAAGFPNKVTVTNSPSALNLSTGLPTVVNPIPLP